MDDLDSGSVLGGVGILIIILTIGIGGCCVVQPNYNVWQQQKLGEAELARADSNRKIATLEAQAVKESSKALADAEIIRAEGVAKANKIIGESLNGNEAYLRYLWVQGLQTNNMQVVYIPTEGNLPILEAGKRK